MTKRKTLYFVGAFYGVTLVAALLLSLFGFLSDTLGHATGRITQQEYDFSSLTLWDMEAQSASEALSTGGDSQLILENLPGKTVDVRFSITFDKAPGEVNLYYKKAGEEFSKDKKIWGKQKSDGSYVFSLPRTRIDAIRVDPTSFAGVHMTLHSFTVNAPRTFASYFAYTFEDVFNFIVYPGLAAAFAAYFCEEIWPACKRRLKREGKQHE